MENFSGKQLAYILTAPTYGSSVMERNSFATKCSQLKLCILVAIQRGHVSHGGTHCVKYSLCLTQARPRQQSFGLLSHPSHLGKQEPVTAPRRSQ